MAGRPKTRARKDLCALGKVPADSRGAFSKFFHPETPSCALHNSGGAFTEAQVVPVELHIWNLSMSPMI